VPAESNAMRVLGVGGVRKIHTAHNQSGRARRRGGALSPTSREAKDHRTVEGARGVRNMGKGHLNRKGVEHAPLEQTNTRGEGKRGKGGGRISSEKGLEIHPIGDLQRKMSPFEEKGGGRKDLIKRRSLGKRGGWKVDVQIATKQIRTDLLLSIAKGQGSQKGGKVPGGALLGSEGEKEWDELRANRGGLGGAGGNFKGGSRAGRTSKAATNERESSRENGKEKETNHMHLTKGVDTSDQWPGENVQEEKDRNQRTRKEEP